jgi:hypothetical protein
LCVEGSAGGAGTLEDENSKDTKTRLETLDGWCIETTSGVLMEISSDISVVRLDRRSRHRSQQIDVGVE